MLGQSHPEHTTPLGRGEKHGSAPGSRKRPLSLGGCRPPPRWCSE